MNKHVRLQMTLLREAFPTNITFEGPFPGVYSHVHPEVGGGVKGLAADLTHGVLQHTTW